MSGRGLGICGKCGVVQPYPPAGDMCTETAGCNGFLVGVLGGEVPVEPPTGTRVAENTETSGGTRYSAGKPGGWWYVPLYGVRLVAEVAMMGAEKYAPMDWRNGQSFSTLLDCAMRHFLEVLERGPLARDSESGKLHLAHVGWNVLALLTFIALGRDDLDDVTPWQGVTAAKKRAAEQEAAARSVSVLDVLREQREEAA